MTSKQHIKIQNGVELWVKMMVEKGELTIGEDYKDKNDEWVFDWTGEDEIIASIMSYIEKYYEIKKCCKNPLDEKCPNCKKGKLIPNLESKGYGKNDWCGHSYKFSCKCMPNLRISSG